MDEDRPYYFRVATLLCLLVIITLIAVVIRVSNSYNKLS
jgi:hypothetical protein